MLVTITLLVVLTGVLTALAISKIGKAINDAISLSDSLPELENSEEKDRRVKPLFATMKKWTIPAVMFGVLCPFLAGAGIVLAILR